MKTRDILIGLVLIIGFIPMINAQVTYGVKTGLTLTDAAVAILLDQSE